MKSTHFFECRWHQPSSCGLESTKTSDFRRTNSVPIFPLGWTGANLTDAAGEHTWSWRKEGTGYFSEPLLFSCLFHTRSEQVRMPTLILMNRKGGRSSNISAHRGGGTNWVAGLAMRILLGRRLGARSLSLHCGTLPISLNSEQSAAIYVLIWFLLIEFVTIGGNLRTYLVSTRPTDSCDLRVPLVMKRI